MPHAPWHEHHEHSIPARDGAGDHVGIVRRPWHDHDSPAIRLELADALRATDSDHLMAASERMLDHVAAELAGRSDDADSHVSPLLERMPDRAFRAGKAVGIRSYPRWERWNYVLQRRASRATRAIARPVIEANARSSSSALWVAPATVQWVL